ncbi:uncharacterized protein MONOS_17605 [Monocercomonoides exilis]|uniref:uncharacterized protein n=1 Tax=Monocercomonoides exilis TaxID=2049356 RepID=UPI003559FDB0|nr:hypothetical protein MONOS_17605 [Monocercomonoides exilis]
MIFAGCTAVVKTQVKSVAENFIEMFDGLEDCAEREQKQKILEISSLMEEMDRKELCCVLAFHLFIVIDKMIDEKKLTLENALVLLKNIGYCKEMKYIRSIWFEEPPLIKIFQKLIINEEKKKEEKNERRLIDLCECYLLLNDEEIPDELLSIIVPCLLKIASKKDKTEEIQKEVETALLALGNIGFWELEEELYLKEMKDIINYHQKHHNLTRLAYQSAWQFFIYRFFNDDSLEEVIANKLHFAREARREIEELTRCIDWKRKKEGRRRKEAKEVRIIKRWIQTFEKFFLSCSLWNEEYEEIIGSIVRVFRASKDKYREICKGCISSLRNAAQNRDVKVDDLLKGRAVDAVLEEIQRPTLNGKIAFESLQFFTNVSRRLKEEADGETDEAKRKLEKRKIFEKMEVEGYEDLIISFHEIFYFIDKKKNINIICCC